MQDYTIEVWTNIFTGTHYASCDCPASWHAASENQETLWTMVNTHREEHTQKGEGTEVI